jgi:hypothetical protein
MLSGSVAHLLSWMRFVLVSVSRAWEISVWFLSQAAASCFRNLFELIIRQ